MSEERKTPFWPWIVALLIGLPILYVASFGPACWLTNRSAIPRGPVAILYGPLVDRGIENRSGIERFLLWYGTVLCKERYSPYATNILFDLRNERILIRSPQP